MCVCTCKVFTSIFVLSHKIRRGTNTHKMFSLRGEILQKTEKEHLSLIASLFQAFLVVFNQAYDYSNHAIKKSSKPLIKIASGCWKPTKVKISHANL